MVFNKVLYDFFKRDKPTQEEKKIKWDEPTQEDENDFKWDKEIKPKELEAKISAINMVAQVLHEDIKELVKEMKNVNDIASKRRT